MQGPKILHLHTVKGKGFEPAEKNPGIWHAPGKFDPETGERITTDTSNLPLCPKPYSERHWWNWPRRIRKIVGITPTMPTGCSMNLLMKAMPDRAFDGVLPRRRHILRRCKRLQPFCNIYSPFIQRAYDVIHDIAILKLPSYFCLDRAGLVRRRRTTHHGVATILPVSAYPLNKKKLIKKKIRKIPEKKLKKKKLENIT